MRLALPNIALFALASAALLGSATLASADQHGAAPDGNSKEVSEVNEADRNSHESVASREPRDAPVHRLAVYVDSASSENHFLSRGAIGDTQTSPAMNEIYSEACHSGATCIQARFVGKSLRKEIQCDCRTRKFPHYYELCDSEHLKNLAADCADGKSFVVFVCEGNLLGNPGCRGTYVYNPWAGWVFNQGILTKRGVLKVNWGAAPNAGLDLQGMTKLTFWARSDSSARVRFFALGTGRSRYLHCRMLRERCLHPRISRATPANDSAAVRHAPVEEPQRAQRGDDGDRIVSHGGLSPSEMTAAGLGPSYCEQFGAVKAACSTFPDSADEVTTGFVTIGKEWRKYAMDLRGRDLSYVIGGFGWTTNALENKNREVTFYLDDIVYERDDS